MVIVKRICLVLLLLSAPLFSATFRVGKTGGQYTTVQAAVNQAKPGDIVEIIDFAVYEEQVTIDSLKNGLTIRSSNPANPRKPVIKYRDETNVHPINGQEALDPAKINFDQNGALRVMGGSNILIEGIAVDGGGHYTFCWEGVWENRYPLFHGNAGICLWLAGYVTIRNCDIRNAHFGIAFKNRNEGGVFANANPADIKPWLVVPLSRYGKMGGHLVENNKIHHNVFGMFNESDWDMGSTIRYNIIYENHYTDAEASVTAQKDGSSHPGGGIELKDNTLTPWAIYNNTFWHNFCHFSGHWQAGPQHLIFNNIFGELNRLWNQEPSNYKGTIGTHAMDKVFPYRMKHCVYDLMLEKPQISQQTAQAGEYDPVQNKYIEVKKTVDVIQRMVIQNNMEVTRSDLVVELVIPLSAGPKTVYQTFQQATVIPGASITPFPTDAKVGYYPVKFKSTDTTSSDFLVPDWEDTVVQRLILDKGWPEAGIIDGDGSPADLGALPKGGIPAEKASIISLFPVMIQGTEANISFNLQTFGNFTNPKVKYFKFIKSLKFNFNTWGNAVTPIAQSSILPVTINSGVPLQVGHNLLKVTPIPTATAADPYALYEMFIEGTNAQGKSAVSSAGFHPFRMLNYFLKIWVMDIAKKDTLDTVTVGDTVLLCLEAYNANGSKFTNDIDSAIVSLASAFNLYDVNFTIISDKKLAGGIPKGYRDVQVIFTKVPKPNGMEFVQGYGVWSGGGSQQQAFPGTSGPIKILPGPAAKFLFQDPTSRKLSPIPTIIDPGIAYPGYLQVYDKFDNDIDESVPVTLSVLNNNPNGRIIGTNPTNTTTTGRGNFTISVQGKENDIITFIGALSTTVSGMVYDSADVKVGKPRNQLWVFYTGAGEVVPNYDSTKILKGYPDERLKATVAVIKDSNNTQVVVPLNEKITVKPMGTDPLKFYASQTGAEQSEFTLVSGKIDVWVTSSVPNLLTGPGYGMTVAPSDLASAVATNEKSTRYKLYFIKPPVPDVSRSAYYDNNGDGFVDLVNITYADTLGGKPDSVYLYWPDKAGERKNILKSNTGMTLSADKKTITIAISPQFTSVQTSGSGKGQSWHEIFQGGGSEPTKEFDIIDSVGPRLINIAYLYEKYVPGNDTLTLQFSEVIRAADITQAAGASFILKKSTGEVNLTIIGSAGLGDLSTITVAIPDMGTSAPAAGDSIRIYAAGPVRDVPGNKAHLNNPLVPIVLKAKPTPIDSASYWDLDANGIVELLKIKLKKKVSIGAIEKVNITFGANAATANASDISYSATDSLTIQIMLTSVYTQAVLKNQGTGGSMSVAVYYNGLTAPESGTAVDKAAPVIASAHYIPGDIISKTQKNPDRLEVTFTENVVSNTHKEPFLFFNVPSKNTYQILMESVSYSTNTAMAMVDTIIGRKYPSNGDSIWINTIAHITDGLGNAQANEKNLRVPMKVDPQPLNLVIKAVSPVAPKEYRFPSKIISQLEQSISFETGVYIRIDPQTESDEGEILKDASITILDAVGNVVASCNTIGEDNGILVIRRGLDDEKLHVFWSGQNRNKRYVGNGVYAFIIEVTDVNGSKAKKKLSIGVQDSQK